MRLLLDFVYLFACIVALAVARVPLVRRTGPARLRACASGSGSASRSPSSIWLHGSSAGEVSVLRPLVAALERDDPDTPLVISAFTATGLAAARKLYAAAPRRAVAGRSLVRRARFLRRLQAALCSSSPNRSSGRISSVRRARPRRAGRARQRQDVGEVVSRARAHAARPARARRISPCGRADGGARAAPRALGVPAARLHVTGNMKYDLARAPRAAPNEAVAAARGLGYSSRRRRDHRRQPARAGGRGAARRLCRGARGERSRRRSIIVPRYPADAAAVEQRARARGLAGHAQDGRRFRRAAAARALAACSSSTPSASSASCMRSRTSRSSAAACSSAARTKAVTTSWSPRSSACPCCSGRTTSVSRRRSTICSRRTRAACARCEPSCARASSRSSRILDCARALGTRAQRVVERGSRRDCTQLRAARASSCTRGAEVLATRRPRPQNAAIP